jgi:hypothetical protein
MYSVMAIFKSSLVWGLLEYTEFFIPPQRKKSGAQRLSDHPASSSSYHTALVFTRCRGHATEHQDAKQVSNIVTYAHGGTVRLSKLFTVQPKQTPSIWSSKLQHLISDSINHNSTSLTTAHHSQQNITHNRTSLTTAHHSQQNITHNSTSLTTAHNSQQHFSINTHTPSCIRIASSCYVKSEVFLAIPMKFSAF